jgi:hypothetical protein
MIWVGRCFLGSASNSSSDLQFPVQVGAELPMDSDEADEENKAENGGKTLLYVFERG